MEQEKNLNEEVSETVEEIAETVEEIAETVEEIAEEATPSADEGTEKVRPEVYDDFAEEAEKVVSDVVETKQMKPASIIAITSVISTVATLVILLVISLVSNFAGILSTKNQVEGTWAFDMGSYAGQSMKVYVIMEDGVMTLAANDGSEYFNCEYKVTGKGTLNIDADDEDAMKMSNLLSEGPLNVTYNKESDSLTFSPAIGGVSTWTAVSDSEAQSIKDAIENYVEPTYDDMSSGVADGDASPDVTEEIPVE